MAEGWTRTFQVTWFVGYLGGGLVYTLLCLVFPPPGKPYVDEPEHLGILNGVENVSYKVQDSDLTHDLAVEPKAST